MLRTLREEFGAMVWVLRTVALAAVAGALYRELRLPPEQRTWHGRLLGVVPYDFRLPTPRRIRDAYFNPNSNTIFTAEPIGVGWAVNVAAILKRLGILSSPARRRTTTATR